MRKIQNSPLRFASKGQAKFKIQNFLGLIFATVLVFLPQHIILAQEKRAVIYYSEACSDCKEYMDATLKPTISSFGYSISDFDYINIPSRRAELVDIHEKWKIPYQLQDNMVAFIDLGISRVAIEGHVPANLISEILQNIGSLPKELVISQPAMHGEATSYKLWTGGEIKEFTISQPILKAVTQTSNTGMITQRPTNFTGLLPLVLVSGFLDGFHPCAFAVLVFFIAFLFTIRQTTQNIYKMGFVYLLGIYLAYFAIGVGLMKAIVFSEQPFLMARIGSVLLIILGLVNIGNYFFPKMPITLGMPKIASPTIRAWVEKSTIPAAFVSGFLVGLCSLPCAGGIYVAVTSLLAAKTTLLMGLALLVIYNFMFILPLVPVLLAAGNKTLLAKIAGGEKRNEKKLKLFLGIGMIVLAFIFLSMVV